MKDYFKILKITFLLSLISANISQWVFFGDWNFLPVPLVSGIILVIAQKGDRVYDFLGKLSAGSVIFGILTPLFLYTEMYLISNLVFKSGMPFWIFYNPKDYLMFSLIFAFVCFVGGLVGIVIKGFYSMKGSGIKS